MEKLEILLSCMFLSEDIAKKSRISSDLLVINQCDEDGEYSYTYDGGRARVINTTQRGLTKSRNMAIRTSDADICLLCDDDECFSKEYAENILDGYKALPDADIIIFDMVNRPHAFGDNIKELSYFDIMKVSSWQISFRRERLLESGVLFDEDMGAGTENGAEEEFKFLSDCRKKGLKIYHYPAEIASVSQEKSTWRNAYDKKFFVNRGNTTRYIMGFAPAVLYAFYYCLTKGEICRETGRLKALGYTISGIAENRFKKLKGR